MKNTSIEFRKQAPIAILLFAIVLLGCGKDEVGPEIDIPQEKEIRVIQYKQGGTYDIIYSSEGYVTAYGEETIVYDSNDRIIATQGAVFEYNGQGQMVKKDQTVIDYNGTGRIISATNNDGSRGEFEYNDKDELTTIITYGPTNMPNSKTLLAYDTKGNISQIKNQQTSDGINYTDAYEGNFTYDEHKNPYYNLLQHTGIKGTFSLIPIFPTSVNTFQQHFYSPNNLVAQENKYFESGLTQNMEYVYSYDEDDYPVSAEKTSLGSNGGTNTQTLSWTYLKE